MALPNFTKTKHVSTYEPIYLPYYDIIIEKVDDIHKPLLLIENIKDISYVNGRLHINNTVYRNKNNDYVCKYFRNFKLNLLLDGKHEKFHKIVTNKFNKMGDVIERIEFIDISFVGCSNEGFHFEYKSLIDTEI